MNYLEAVSFITNVEKFGSVYGLETVRELLRRLDCPQRKLKFVHIAGTNGKGSVSCFLTSVLKEAGYTVGTFNSPSVFGYNERYLVGGQPVDDATVAKLLTKVRDVREQMNIDGLLVPTAFEIELAVALLWFVEQSCDIVVLETGLGGRLDATNVIEQKALAIVTSIALDHMSVLGDTLTQIATEKVAIVKNCPLVTFEQNREVMDVLNKVDDLRLSEKATSISDSLNGQVFEVNNTQYQISMLGEHQLENASLAIKAIEVLRERNFVISESALKQGLLNAKWAGRLELFSKINNKNGNERLFLLDGAHNPDGALKLNSALKHYFYGKRIALIFGMFSDKDVLGVAKILGESCDEMFLVTPPSSRGLDAKKLKQIVEPYCDKTVVAESMKDAVSKAFLSSCDLICVCGSLSILAPARYEILKLR